MSDTPKKNTSAKMGWRERLVKGLDMPGEVLRGGMRVEMRGRELILVEGCRRILAYTPQCVMLQMKGCRLIIEGERLLCHSYLSGAVGLEGFVFCVRFEEDVC